MEREHLQGIGYIKVASRPTFSSVSCNSHWENEVINEGGCTQQILSPEENQMETLRSRSPDPSSLSVEPTDDPANAWFNAAGILLSLKHAAAERNAKMGSPMEVTPWDNDPVTAHEQADFLHAVNGFPIPTNATSILDSNGAMTDQNEAECMPELYPGTLAEEVAVAAHQHIPEDSGTKVNKCRLCDKMYARPSTLRTHMRTHSGEKPYKCHICMKSFSQDANLTAHLRIHSGEKPFKCSVCDRRFAQSSSVTTHMRTHTGERPYRCRMCSRGFADSSTLTKHLRTHTGEKPYKCKICQLRFSQSGNLNRHMRVHEQGI